MFHTLVCLTCAANHPARRQQWKTENGCTSAFWSCQIKVSSEGDSAVQVQSEMSPPSQTSPPSFQWFVLKTERVAWFWNRTTRGCNRPSDLTAWQPSRTWTRLRVTPHDSVSLRALWLVRDVSLRDELSLGGLSSSSLRLADPPLAVLTGRLLFHLS